MELPTTLNWKDKPDVPGWWLRDARDGDFAADHYTARELKIGNQTIWQGAAYALLRPDPPPEPKPENLRAGEWHPVSSDWKPCLYVDFLDQHDRVPIYTGEDWMISHVSHVRPSTGKD